MDQETYKAHIAKIKSGEMVMVGGRSALNEEQLHFAIQASKDTVPGDPQPVDHELEAVLADNLEGKELKDIQDLAASLGLTVTGKEDKDSLIEGIRAVHLSMQHKP